MFAIIIDSKGFKVEFVVLNEDGIPQGYTLKDGESVVQKSWDIANGMNKPQWDGAKLIDTDHYPLLKYLVVYQQMLRK
ncbi:MAG: hypothetical protein ACRDD8_02355 [Bacteroidales bacterium]